MVMDLLGETLDLIIEGHDSLGHLLVFHVSVPDAEAS